MATAAIAGVLVLVVVSMVWATTRQARKRGQAEGAVGRSEEDAKRMEEELERRSRSLDWRNVGKRLRERFGKD